MKTFIVYLRDGRIAFVRAAGYRHEAHQYIFEVPAAKTAQFFVDSEVTGISEAASGQEPGLAPTGARPASARRRGGLIIELQNEAILKALSACEGNRTTAAKVLGISRRALFNRLQQLGLKRSSPTRKSGTARPAP